MPSQTARFLRTEMKEIQKAIGALNVAKNITYVGAARKKSVDGFDELTLVAEGTLMDFSEGAHPGSPEPDAGKVTAGVVAFVVRAEKMD
jgi:hypothetical protein